jgi:phosphatidate phosphatase LPIN
MRCLQTIRDLFPPDWNPFYAGFGNRNTDTVSYASVGVPPGRNFTINPRSEVGPGRDCPKCPATNVQALVC